MRTIIIIGVVATIAATSWAAVGRPAGAAPSTPQEPWPNEPAGMTLILEDDWTGGDWTDLGRGQAKHTNGWVRKTPDIEIVPIDDHPNGAPHALRITTPAGTEGGYGPEAYYERQAFGAGYREVYFGWWGRISPDFVGHGSGSNKHAYIGGRTAENRNRQRWFMPWGGGRLPVFGLRWDGGALGPNCHSSGTVPNVMRPGRWYRIEMLYRMPEHEGPYGIWQIWVDGRLVVDRDDICDEAFGPSSHLKSVTFSGIWGGRSANLARDQWAEFGPFRVTGRTPVEAN